MPDRSSSTVVRALGLIGVLIVASILSGYYRDLARAFANDGASYAQRRIDFAFRGIDLERIRDRVDSLLPRSTAVALGPGLRESSFWSQRLAETLYPRPLVADAPNVLHPRRPPFVSGPDVRPRAAPAALENLAWSPWSLLAGALAVLGFGWTSRSLFLPDRSRDLGLATACALVRGAIILAWLALLATWTGVSLPTRWSLLAGLVLLVCAVVGGWRRRGRRRFRIDLPSPESTLPVLLVLGCLVYLVSFPGALWDGRSIWLFHAKQLALNGSIPAAELTRPELQWSHPDYPLLYPMWLALFTAAESVYSERAATLGIAVLTAAVLVVVWRLARELLGRWSGLLLTIVPFLGAAHGILGAYADGVTMLLLLGAVLGFLGADRHSIGWMCAVAASMTKFEGALFAAIIVGVLAASGRIRLAPAAFFLPVVAHAIWARWIGISSDFDGIRPFAALATAKEQLEVVARQLGFVLQTGGYNKTYGLLWIGGFAFVLAAARLAVERCWRSDAARVLLLSAGLTLVVLALLLLSPRPVDWLAQTAADRLLMHPAALALLALLLTLRAKRREGTVQISDAGRL